MSKQKSLFTLIGLDIEGEWNIPLLSNAAESAKARMIFSTRNVRKIKANNSLDIWPYEETIKKFDSVIVCETHKKSNNIYHYPAPRGNVAIVVGNELQGVPEEVIRAADGVVNIPMYGPGMSSLNVAVAGCIALYSVDKDFGRRNLYKTNLKSENIDVLVLAVKNPYEVGSLLRTAWAFGWKKLYMLDEYNVWFGADRNTITAGRAAARKGKNPIVVLPHSKLDEKCYDHVLFCNSKRIGTPLSKLKLPNYKKILAVYGDHNRLRLEAKSHEQVYIDYSNNKVSPYFRHSGSILLSYLTQCFRN